MWCFTIYNPATKKEALIFGYTYADALKRAGLNALEWTFLAADYED